MGTTITQTSLISTISESISINGVVYGNSISKSFEGNGKVDQRVMEINSAALTPIFDFTAAVPDSAGSGVQSEFTYFRVTNTDNSVKADGAEEPVVSAYIEYLAVFKGGEPLPDTP